MKTNLFGIILLFTACCAVEGFTSSPSGKLAKQQPPAEERKHVVKLYPNPTYNGTISVSNNGQDKLHFYIFELDGTMIHQSVLANKQKQTVNNLKKGVYMYDAFRNDLSIEHGKIIVK
jgi:hypothetical protein